MGKISKAFACKSLYAMEEMDIKPPIRKQSEMSYKTTSLGSLNPIPRHISREKHNLKRYMHSNVHCSMIYNSQDMEAT